MRGLSSALGCLTNSRPLVGAGVMLFRSMGDTVGPGDREEMVCITISADTNGRLPGERGRLPADAGGSPCPAQAGPPTELRRLADGRRATRERDVGDSRVRVGR